MSQIHDTREVPKYFDEEVRDEVDYLLNKFYDLDPEQLPEEEILEAADKVADRKGRVEPILSALEVQYGEVSAEEVRDDRLHLEEEYELFKGHLEELAGRNSRETDIEEDLSFTKKLAGLEEKGYIPLKSVCESDELPYPYDIMEISGSRSWDEVIERVNDIEGTEFVTGITDYTVGDVLGTLESNRRDIDSKMDARTHEDLPKSEHFYEIRWEDGLEEALEIAGAHRE